MRANGSRNKRASIGLPQLAAALALAAAVLVATVGLFSNRSRSVNGLSDAFAARPRDANVLHLRATKSGFGPETMMEAWLDLTTNEGKIVEAAPDGTVRRIEAVAGDMTVEYRAEIGAATIRRGFGSTSPYALRIRNQLRGPHASVERGQGQVVGQGRVGDHATDRIRVVGEGRTYVADVDRATNLVLREEVAGSDGFREVQETTYSTIEHIGRASLAADSFAVALPNDVRLEQYTDGDPRDPQPATAGVDYAVYTLPSGIGGPTSVFRRVSNGPGRPSSDSCYLSFEGATGEVTVRSSSSDPATRQSIGGKPPLPRKVETLRITSATWEVDLDVPGKFQASATLGDAYVTIYAPDRATFERAVIALQRLSPA